MTAGFQVTQVQVNNQAGSLAVGIRTIFQQIVEFQNWLDEVGSAGLEALGFVADDAATLISAFNDLNDLNNIYNGAASTHLTGTYAYQTFAKQLTGYQ
jgi:hypothetical protein